jgi:hypothetical protein
VVVLYRRFRTTYLYHIQESKSARRKTFFLQFLTLEDWTDSLSRNVDTEPPLTALRNIPEEHRYQSPDVLDFRNSAWNILVTEVFGGSVQFVKAMARPVFSFAVENSLLLSFYEI